MATFGRSADNYWIATARRDAIPPHAYFLVSAIFHYLGPSFAVLLFARLDVLGVAWLRIASAAVVFGVWAGPWTFFSPPALARSLVPYGFGFLLWLKDQPFLSAIARLPLATVG